jgi:hypothetical protein
MQSPESINTTLKIKKMKRIGLLLGLVAFATVVFSQTSDTTANKQNEDINTLFGGKDKLVNGWFIGPSVTYSQFDQRDVWLVGLSVGWVIDHNFTIGLSGNTFSNKNQLFYDHITDTTGAYLEGGYGGLLLEYTLFPKSIVHVTFPLIIGGGCASYVAENEAYDDGEGDWDWDTDHKTLDSDHYFVIEPGVKMEINICKFMRFDAGVTYRYVGDLRLMNTSNDMMNNFSATVGLKFGKF